MKFKKKPVIIDAIQWLGNNLDDITTFVAGKIKIRRADGEHRNDLIIDTLEDGPTNQVVHYASKGDWIIKGVSGEFYPCKPAIFEATYEYTNESDESKYGVPPHPSSIVWRLEYATPGHPPEEVFDYEQCLAYLLMNRIIFSNSNWWKKDWPEEAQKSTALFVNCNDVFAWGCAYGEDFEYEDLRCIYEHVRKDPVYGSDVWCIKHRNMMPQKPVAERIRKQRIWDLDSMGLEPNRYDTFCK